MEEDIKTLKDETNALGLFFKCRGMDCYKKSLENILNELDRLQKENEELKERYKNKVKQMKEYRDENYIPKQVIRAVRDKAECMDYYGLVDVIDDLEKILNEGE